MTHQNPPRRFTPMSQTATDYPAPLSELHACASERLNAALAYLHLMACSNVSDYAEHDINTAANTARIMVQDVADVFTVMERRGFDSPAVS
ncbi:MULTISPECIES: fructose-bisphosphate aldolase [unclassified Pseudomonas]|uniref:fructose-bisphosphate aldolase n=1 Tax=unclassified Pseudomonas TaxID=196821 RepID=UPI0023E39BC0|nr:fructose-bisphosphate aldolase [Pseudomonas sp. D3]WET08449.1 fructose-bisphosphate aldolase [Pseudomonas sp. D3]